MNPIISFRVGASPAAADLFAGEKEKKTMEALLMTPVKRSTLVISKWLTITTIGVLTGLITLLVVVLEIAFLRKI
ncbi:ABC transporter permease subunit [Niallia circulans]